MPPFWFWILISWAVFDLALFVAEKCGVLSFSNEIVKYCFYAPFSIPFFAVLLPIAGVMRLFFKIKWALKDRNFKRKK